MAIIFLLGGCVLYRLFSLQVLQNDLYVSLASSQHEATNILAPERGKIFFSSDSGDLYPIATNKDFAQVYVVPQDVNIAARETMAEQFYLLFNEAKVIEEVEELLEEEDKQRLVKELEYINALDIDNKDERRQQVINEHYALMADKTYLELKKAKRETEIESRKTAIINGYLEKINKPNDPYEPIQKKVDKDVLKRLYIVLSKNTGYAEKNLIVEDGAVYYQNTDGDLEEVIIDGLGFRLESFRFYPEGDIGANLTGFVSMGDNIPEGNYGLEGFFNEELSGEYGMVSADKNARGEMIIINDMEYTKPIDGSTLVLTIDRSIQYEACKKLNEFAEAHPMDGGSVIIMRPESGEILAMCSYPNYDPNDYQEVEDISVYNNPAIFDQYEPGSIFKTITMAAALDQGKVTPETTYYDEGQIMVKGWDKPIKNSDFDTHGGYGEATMNSVLENSLNTGAIFAMEQVGADIFAQYVKNFGFGEKTGIEMETENAGNIKYLEKEKIQEIYAATASFGQGITVTPLQMVTAYSAIANSGVLMKPYVVKKITDSDGHTTETQPLAIKRVISDKAATILSGMLVNVIDSGHAKLAAVDGYYLGGKTGTAQVASASARGYGSQTIHTFVGFGPIEDPKFVMLVKLDSPADYVYAASSAAPLFGEIAEFVLNYWQVPKVR
jgi:cell division protein FtsI/penicillin-binding protein 2